MSNVQLKCYEKYFSFFSEKELLNVTIPEQLLNTESCLGINIAKTVPSDMQTFLGSCLQIYPDRLKILDPTYGMYVWPSAPVLAQYIWYFREKIANKKIIEIGAGTSLPGIVAAKCGGSVILSDSKDLPQCQENCRRSCLANQLTDIRVIGLTWGIIDADLINMDPVDIILGSDCFYNTKDFEDILVTVAFLLEKNDDAEFLCSYQVRSSTRSIDFILWKWGLVCRQIPLESFGADTPNIAGSNLPGDHTIHMLIITKENT